MWGGLVRSDDAMKFMGGIHSHSSVVGKSHKRVVSHKIDGSDSARSWKSWEEDLLKEIYPEGGFKAIQAALPHRSKGAIYSMAARLRIRCKEESATPQSAMPVVEIAKGLGVSQKDVISWIESEELWARRRGNSYVVSITALRRWLGVHAHEVINLDKVSRDWFLLLAFPELKERSAKTGSRIEHFPE